MNTLKNQNLKRNTSLVFVVLSLKDDMSWPTMLSHSSVVSFALSLSTAHLFKKISLNSKVVFLYPSNKF